MLRPDRKKLTALLPAFRAEKYPMQSNTMKKRIIIIQSILWRFMEMDYASLVTIGDRVLVIISIKLVNLIK